MGHQQDEAPTRALLRGPGISTTDARIAFVFQGGGSLTAAQVGMLWALTEAGLTPDFVIGSSAGALNAVAFASDPSDAGLDRLEALWVSLRRRRVAPFSLRTIGGVVLGHGDAMVSNAALRRLLENYLGAPHLGRGTFSDLCLPAHVVATELRTGRPVVLSEGDLVGALLASCAFPGLYPPVDVDGRALIDGGVSADIPILPAESLGATVTYVLPAGTVHEPGARPHGPLPMAFHALGQILESATRHDAADAAGVVHVLPAPPSQATNPIDFRETTRLIDEGYRLASDWTAAHLAASATGIATVAPKLNSHDHPMAISAV